VATVLKGTQLLHHAKGSWYFDPTAWPGWLDWIGLALTVFGFALTGWQLWRTANASRAATRALSDARRRLATDQLAATLPHIATAGNDLNWAMDNNNREVAHRALLRFSEATGEVVALLDNIEESPPRLAARVAQAGDLALDIKDKVMRRKALDVGRDAKGITRELEALSNELQTLVARRRYSLGEDERV
jgi:hypothetical protein